MRAGIAGFTGVDHRLQFVRRWAGIDWYNDSIATAPERSIAAIRSFDEPLVLLAGGRDKDLPWDLFVEIVNQRVDHLILFGEASERIADHFEKLAFQDHKRLESITECKNLHQAVLAASRIANPGDVVLLAPGGTSFDEFSDFEERGEWYKKWVNEL
jgi:UDP-N-acetylmuramoylalanine--D-glutamate ligase